MSIDPRIASGFEAQNGFPLAPHLVVLALMGSHSHGTYLPPEEPNAIDDVDLMASWYRHSGTTSDFPVGSTGRFTSTSWTSCCTASRSRGNARDKRPRFAQPGPTYGTSGSGNTWNVCDGPIGVTVVPVMRPIDAV